MAGRIFRELVQGHAIRTDQVLAKLVILAERQGLRTCQPPNLAHGVAGCISNSLVLDPVVQGLTVVRDLHLAIGALDRVQLAIDARGGGQLRGVVNQQRRPAISAFIVAGRFSRLVEGEDVERHAIRPDEESAVLVVAAQPDGGLVGGVCPCRSNGRYDQHDQQSETQ